VPETSFPVVGRKCREGEATVASQVLERMPRRVKVALGVVWFQAIVTVIGAFALLSLINDDLDHGRDIENLGLIRFIVYTSLIAAVVLIVSAIAAPRRFGWTRTCILVVEGISIASGLIGIFTGAPTGIIGVVLSFLVMGEMRSGRARDWFNR
jgi:uncharacterized membrane protein